MHTVKLNIVMTAPRIIIQLGIYATQWLPGMAKMLIDFT